ncbi:MAG: hypothetical protein KME30_10760 [Iphinoe sp. HA4291-MV1]|nr:hypothetical protein [Iphinoe sp. HA4291-MV1]
MFTLATLTSVMIAFSKFNAPVAKFSLEHLGKRFETVELQFNDVKHSKDSFEIRVFLNQPDADVNTPLEGNDHFAGSLFVYGQGEYVNETGERISARETRAQEFDLSPGASNTTAFKLYLDITDSLRKMAAKNLEIIVNLVAVDFKGNQIIKPEFDFGSISLITN